MNIIITGAGGPAGDALWRLLGHKYEVYFADRDIKKIHPAIPKSRNLSIPSAEDPSFLAVIQSLIQKYEIDLILSQVDEELIQLKSLENIDSKLLVMSPGIDFISMCLDKESLGLELQKNRIMEPKTRILNIDSTYGEKSAILKPATGRGSRDVFTALNEEQFYGLKRYLLGRSEKFIIQDLILGTEYTVQMISDRFGNLSTIVPLQVIEKRGSTTQCETSYNSVVIAECLKIHELYRPTGTYNVQLVLEDALEHAHIIEINPRVSTTMCFSLELGFDPIEIFCNNLIQANPIIPDVSMRLDRYWENHFSKSGEKN